MSSLKVFFPYNDKENSAGEYAVVSQYYLPRSDFAYTSYPISRKFGNRYELNEPIEVVFNNVLSKVSFLVEVGYGNNSLTDLSKVVFDAFDFYGNKIGTTTPYTDSSGRKMVTFTYSTAGAGEFPVAAGIKKVRINAPFEVQLGVVAYLAGVPLDVPATWKNGITRMTVSGAPPENWELRSDTWWYPKTHLTSDTSPDMAPAVSENLVVEMPTPQAPTVHLTYRVRIQSVALPQTTWQVYKVRMTVLPGKQILPEARITSPVRLDIRPIPLALRRAFNEEFRVSLDGKFDTFFDDDRVLKTLMNFGQNYQLPITNWRRSQDGVSGLLKLYRPIPAELDLDDEFFISREISTPLIDLAFIVDATQPLRVYLRPPNNKIKLVGTYGNIRQNATLETLLSTGSFDIVSPNDDVMEQWYTTALEGAELNIEYSNYKNFVFYSSAQKRLETFKNKLLELEDLTSVISFNSASFSTLTGSAYITGSPAYASIYSLAEQRQDLIRSFDPYERFLYYEQNVPFSGTFVGNPFNDVDDKFYDIPDTTWPKISGSIAPYASASSWYQSQMEVAYEYDSWNVNRFVNNIPFHIQEDRNSQEFLTFLDMIGHMFDTIKLYADNMSNIYDRQSDSNVGISKDLIWNVARSFGLDLPNQYSLNSLATYTIGSHASGSSYRDFAAETWKRFLHNQVLLAKTKGTKTALRSLLNVYGILPTTVQIRESITPSYFYASKSFETIEENTNTLNMESGSFISIPWSSSIGNDPINAQIRFATTTVGINQVLFQADEDWALELIPGTGSYYSVGITSGSTTTLQSPYYEIGNGQYYTAMVQYSPIGTTLYVKQSDDDGDLIINSETTEPDGTGVSSVWHDPNTLYLGASGTFFGTPFKGEIDEFRIWGETTTEETFDNWVRYPALYNGNDPLSALNYLWVRLSFNKPKNLGGPTSLDQTVYNESPYQKNYGPADMVGFTSSFFANEFEYPYSFTVSSRTVQRLTPSAGGTQFDSNKIVIADPPAFEYMSGSSVPVLSRKNSIVSLEEKNDTFVKPNNLIGFYFSPTEAINDSIIKTIGNIDLHDYIGDPRDQFSTSYPLLEQLNELYWKYYAYDININQFLEFVSDLLNPLFEQAHKLVPVRAKLLTGIVIEPHILERNKIPLKPLKFEDNSVLKSEIVTTQPEVISANIDLTQAIFSVSESQQLDVSYVDNKAVLTYEDVVKVRPEYDDIFDVIDVSTITTPVVKYNNYSATHHVSESFAVIHSEYTDYGSTIDFYTDVYLRSALSYNKAMADGVISSDTMFIPTYGPISDIDRDIGAYTYFTDPNGHIGVVEYQRIRQKQNILVDEGVWVAGGVYSANDYVRQEDVLVAGATAGNGKEFYAITQNFISHIPPYLDRANWRPVAYVNKEMMSIKKVVDIDGSLSLVPTGSALPPVIGYRSNHYIYTRPMDTAYVNARYVGCVQTAETTFDGKPPIEISDSAGDELYVQNRGGKPIVPVNNPAGPILDVR